MDNPIVGEIRPEIKSSASGREALSFARKRLLEDYLSAPHYSSERRKIRDELVELKKIDERGGR